MFCISKIVTIQSKKHLNLIVDFDFEFPKMDSSHANEQLRFSPIRLIPFKKWEDPLILDRFKRT